MGPDDWQLKPHELAEDGFWLLMGAFLWGPHQRPLPDADFRGLRRSATLAPRDHANPQPLPGSSAPDLQRICTAFPYYWLHRYSRNRVLVAHSRDPSSHHQDEFPARRTHPFEYFALSLGSLTVMAFMGASDDVLAVSAARHVERKLITEPAVKSLPVYDWVFATAQHHVHHALERRQSDSNYGCNIILWDRVSTYCGDETSDVKQMWPARRCRCRSRSNCARVLPHQAPHRSSDRAA